MALSIKTTPTLRGKEAVEFQKKADANKNKCAPRKEVKKAIDAYKLIMSRTAYEKELEAMRKFAKSLTKKIAIKFLKQAGIIDSKGKLFKIYR